MPAKPSLTLQRRINASPAKIYAAWTDPSQLVKWMHPNNNDVIHAKMDVRVGGRFRIIMRSPAGEEHDVSGVFKEVVQDEKLVYTWAWRSTPERESLVTFTLRRDGELTLLTLKHEQFFDETARDNHEAGWNEILDGLVREFA
ncbi:activator of Hsp90 ATPase 1 family protein [Caballeronia sordidicola]|uniref:Activator of Hsp90 ATPase 1 family protein n=1 Tax=Caballeronia sordidicola TaxID=196367 RepID=A0A158H762_CABSO|nr:SRPBCC domain-containing protein [Caballeronia sordidicola]SAL40116.1 activator of Hsp90 ATPase 1 family protein [Caballeronia sordidicola]